MRGPGRLFWKLFLGTALLTAAVLTVCAGLAVRRIEAFTEAALRQHLLGHAHLLADMVEGELQANRVPQLDALAKKVIAHYPQPIRVTFILADGRVVGDSLADPTEMESHAGRREVVDALQTGRGDAEHLSHTVGTSMRYAAVRVGSADAPEGVVRVAMSTQAMGEHSKDVRWLIGRIFLVGAAALIVFALGLARLWSRPIQQMTAIARSLSRGDLSARVSVSGNDEVAELGRSLNRMRDHLAGQLETIDRQRRILESLLAQLLEGVIVVGHDGRIVLINPEAVRLMGLDTDQSRPAIAFERMDVLQFVSDPQLRELLVGHRNQKPSNSPPAPAESPTVQEARLRVQTSAGEVFVLARASDIRLPHAAADGASEPNSNSARLVVLTDVSELTRAMQVRTDFAANASHELRTPLSAIMGSIETLLEMDLAKDSEAARHFLQIVQRHADRMQAMVSDLLDLSRLESAADRFKPEPVSVRQQLAELHSRHAEAIGAKHLQWQTDVEPGLDSISVNAHLLRLTLDNLVDNAIKFTEQGGFVRASCRRATHGDAAGPHVVLEISDNGCGIPEDQQSRVFERFYQVERARSGSSRGTGLGLSIVRHAVAAMGGKVELRSTPGEGTTVSVFIPQERRT
ncbi:MAG TPA: ATP-binding protein [Phycisphaerae bacterium]|nr:ATP-binding protein [Phycisphaerae bacterium]HOM50666.1 ATP-binding protein [Phycisphaerae bacterium]HON69068.1 ATP-binding protein [Phycisphaerae bacterium]HOQ85088.1 ATP-binding protein [Phycisphaerae bacterium]HPP26150.1 ATP-binding protein [Phycisphaerae bacterium]